MSDATRQFTMVVQAVPVMRITPLDLANTILRTCPDCMELTPHYITEDGYTCSVCGYRSYKPTAQTNAGG